MLPRRLAAAGALRTLPPHAQEVATPCLSSRSRPMFADLEAWWHLKGWGDGVSLLPERSFDVVAHSEAHAAQQLTTCGRV